MLGNGGLRLISVGAQMLLHFTCTSLATRGGCESRPSSLLHHPCFLNCSPSTASLHLDNGPILLVCRHDSEEERAYPATRSKDLESV